MMAVFDRWNWRRWWLLAFVLVLIMPMTASGATDAGGTPQTSTEESYTVTLVTGDRVTVTGESGIAVNRGEGRDHVAFLGHRIGRENYVIPSDALPLLRAGRLDKRLFNVSLLREFGYDQRSELPLIVTADGARRTTSPASGAAHIEVVADLPVVNGVAIEVANTDTSEFWNDLTDQGEPGAARMAAGVSKVWLDGLRQPMLDESVPLVGAPAAWDLDLDGSGITVAVLDTGIDARHPDLADRIIDQENFTEGTEDNRDLVGHGSHVASILAGSGAASGGQFRGVAPGVQLLDGKVCVNFGCPDSWILAGMQWAVEQDADVVNMSLGGPDTPDTDLLEQAVDTLTEDFGVLFVVAAGNRGFDGAETVDSPASADSALAVGSVDKSDGLASDSGRGPRLDGALKPDMTAPGVRIVAARSADGFLGVPGEDYMSLDGTSMATPHVAGAAAILAQQNPEWSPDQLKTVLMNSATAHAALDPYEQGAGRLDVAGAIDQTVTSSPASVSFERQPWPHDDDQPETRTVTYQNEGDAEITLDLAMNATGPDGGPASEGFFSLSEETVTVPAGGVAEVNITADLTAGNSDGHYGGHLTATGDGVGVTTAFAVHRESERYDLTLEHIDRTGSPTVDYSTTVIRVENHEFIDVVGPATTSVRVPPGEYMVLSSIIEGTSGDENSQATFLVQPSVLVEKEETVVVDAREGEEISVTVPNPEAEPVQTAVQSLRITDFGTLFSWVTTESLDRAFSGQLGPDQSLDGYSSTVSGTWARPNPEGRFSGSPYSYHGTWFTVGRMVTGFEKHLKRGDLAVVQADHAVHVPGAVSAKTTWGYLPGVVESALGVNWQEDLPFTRTEYHNTDGGVQWRKRLDEGMLAGDPDFPFLLPLTITVSDLTEYRSGQVRELWNRGVFGPVLPSTVGQSSVNREGDQMLLAPSAYGDGAGRPQSGQVSGTMRVFRNEELFAEFPSLFAFLTVPSDPADYRVEIDATRGAQFPLSTETSLTWTFRSGRVDDDTTVPLPVAAVRFSPSLDQNNTAPAGRSFLVPVEVQPQAGSDWGDVENLSVEVSFDDGQTWQEAPIVGGQRIRMKHPDEDGFVSLRSTVASTDGNTTEQTIIRAYQIKE